ncbi:MULTISPECIES: hypothetical protein [unclassified Pseudactinotalea]
MRRTTPHLSTIRRATTRRSQIAAEIAERRQDRFRAQATLHTRGA